MLSLVLRKHLSRAKNRLAQNLRRLGLVLWLTLCSHEAEALHTEGHSGQKDEWG